MGESNSGIRNGFKPLVFLKHFTSDNESYVNCVFPTASYGACPSYNYTKEADPAFKPLIIALSVPSNNNNISWSGLGIAAGSAPTNEMDSRFFLA